MICLWYRPWPPSDTFPCTVCCTSMGSSIFCNSCKHWVHKKCSEFKRLTKDHEYRCTWCQGTAYPFHVGRHTTEGPDKLEVIASFCYLHVQGMLSVASGYEFSTTHVKTAWKKFKELLPVFSSHHRSFKTWLHIQLLCVEVNASCQ